MPLQLLRSFYFPLFERWNESGGPGIVLSTESVGDWIRAGRSISRGGVGGTMQFMLLKSDIIKSNFKNTNRLYIVSAY
jgi:hypothetical protein